MGKSEPGLQRNSQAADGYGLKWISAVGITGWHGHSHVSGRLCHQETCHFSEFCAYQAFSVVSAVGIRLNYTCLHRAL